MRFMNLIKSTENAGPPPKALLNAIAKFGEEAIGPVGSSRPAVCFRARWGLGFAFRQGN